MKKLLITLLLLPTLVFAWAPNKPVNVIIGFAPGSGNEMAFRAASAIVEKNNPGVVFVVNNKPGAGAALAYNLLVESESNGLTIGVPSHMGLFVTNDIWQKNLKKFNWDSFINVVTLGKSPLVLVANSKSDVNTPADFVKLIKQGTRPVNVGVGGGAHLMAFEYIMLQTKGNSEQTKPINYKGPLQAVTGVAGGEIEFGIMPVAVAKPLIDSGKVKVIGLTTSEKLDQFPTLASAVPGISVYAGWMLALPPATPKEIIAWYQAEFSKAVTSKEYRTWAAQNFVLVFPNELTPEGTRIYGEKIRKQFEPIIKKLVVE